MNFDLSVRRPIATTRLTLHFDFAVCHEQVAAAFSLNGQLTSFAGGVLERQT